MNPTIDLDKKLKFIFRIEYQGKVLEYPISNLNFNQALDLPHNFEIIIENKELLTIINDRIDVSLFTNPIVKIFSGPEIQTSIPVKISDIHIDNPTVSSVSFDLIKNLQNEIVSYFNSIKGNGRFLEEFSITKIVQSEFDNEYIHLEMVLKPVLDLRSISLKLNSI